MPQNGPAEPHHAGTHPGQEESWFGAGQRAAAMGTDGSSAERARWASAVPGQEHPMPAPGHLLRRGWDTPYASRSPLAQAARDQEITGHP